MEPDSARRVRQAGEVVVGVVDPLCPAAVDSLRAYFAELDHRFDGGFDAGNAAFDDASSFVEPDGSFMVATYAAATVACGAIQRVDSECGEIKRMWVSSDWRGVGLGRRMLGELERRAGELGYRTLRLDTNDVLTEAIALYVSAGYHSIERYNDNSYARCWFEKDLT